MLSLVCQSKAAFSSHLGNATEFTDLCFKYHGYSCYASNCCMNDSVSIFSGTSFPGIAESNNGTGDAVVQPSPSLIFRGKTDLIIHKGKLLGNASLHVCH